MIKKYFLLNALFVLSVTSYAEPLDPVKLLSSYVGIDTVNPPGNESRAVDFYAKIFEEEGIEFSSAESAPGQRKYLGKNQRWRSSSFSSLATYRCCSCD